MASLTVFKFSTVSGADQALQILKSFQAQQMIEILDAAIVSWPEGKKGPDTRQDLNTTGAGALGGAFWGLLFGLLFFIPLLGIAVGAGAGALGGAMTDVGIDDDFIKNVRSQVQPGTSALFVMSSDAVIDKVHDAFKGMNAELLRTNLSQ